MKDVCFVLSTGRCGTQSLAAWLAAVAGDAATVTHEPLGLGYRARERLTNDSDSDELPEQVLEHFAAIENLPDDQQYIECGFPLWSTVPYLLRRFAGRVRIVHLVRHPVPVAFSWTTHRAYCPPLLPHTPERVLLSPFDRAARHAEYRDRWPSLPPHEKVLYYWLEVNSLGADLEQTSGIPWLTIRFEDFVAGRELERIASFIGFDHDGGSVPPNVDRHRFPSELSWNPERLRDHPAVLTLAERFGYAFGDADLQQLRPRGLPAVHPR